MRKTGFGTDILIIGGGIAGLTLAALLGRSGIAVRLVEGFPPKPLKDTAPSGRTVALMERSLDLIKTAGAWEACEAHAAPLKTMRIIDRSIAGREDVTADFESAEIGQAQFGFNIPNSILRAALYEAVQKNKNITLHAPAKLADYKADGSGINATLEDGTHIRARLIVGVDGRASPVRKIAGISTRTHDYKQTAITCLLNHSRAHEHISTEFHRPGGPLALVPLPGNCSSLVWVERNPRAETLMEMRESQFLEALEEETGGLLGGMTLETQPESWKLSSLCAKSLTAQRTVLAAEAAHVISPITAQGLNLSLRDIAALHETLVEAARLGLDPGSKAILDQYERRRRLDIATRIAGVNGINRIVSNDIPAVKTLRRRGLRLLDKLPALKHFATKQALAPEVDQKRA
ncbi:MAG: FAD-dependent monooxygenase [Alphaproteobacteria bacterium]|nr:FAD-dependent monooxygenase [Alphaproteobacteria bacterium]